MPFLIWSYLALDSSMVCRIFPFPSTRTRDAYNPSKGLYQDFGQLSSLTYQPSVVRQLKIYQCFFFNCLTTQYTQCQRGDFIMAILDCYGAVFPVRSPVVFLPCLFSKTWGKGERSRCVLAMWHTKESIFEFWSLCIQWNLLRRTPLGTSKSARLIEVSVLWR